jgi:hypothetical protein
VSGITDGTAGVAVVLRQLSALESVEDDPVEDDPVEELLVLEVVLASEEVAVVAWAGVLVADDSSMLPVSPKVAAALRMAVTTRARWAGCGRRRRGRGALAVIMGLRRSERVAGRCRGCGWR